VRGLIVAALALASCAAPPEAPAGGIPFLEVARGIAGRDVLGPADLVPVLRELATRHHDSPEQLIRTAYFVLLLWEEDADWEVVRPTLMRDGVLRAQQWTAGQPGDRWVRIQFTAQPAAWVSPGGHSYDLVVEADVKFDVAGGRRSRGRVRNPEAMLRATINQDRHEAATAGGYPPGSLFLQAMMTGAQIAESKNLPFLTAIQAQYQGLWDRWADLSSFGYDIRAEFVDHPGARFESATQFSSLPATWDPPFDKEERVHPGEKPDRFTESPAELQLRGGWSSSFGDDGHGFVRADAGDRESDDC